MPDNSLYSTNFSNFLIPIPSLVVVNAKAFDMIMGASYRLYEPNSYGSIFSDTILDRGDTLADGSLDLNAEFAEISVYEFGAFSQLSKRICNDKLKITASARMDKSKNYEELGEIPSKISFAADLAKKEMKKGKKVISKKEETLTLVDEDKDENSNGALVLDTLANESIDEIKEEKYIPPKTRKHLSPSVRKIVQESNIDISSIKGTGKAGRISKGDLIKVMGKPPHPSKRNITHGKFENRKYKISI